MKIESDESIKMIREWRKGADCAKRSLSGTLNAHLFALNSENDAPLKNVKPSYSSVSISQKHVSHIQLSSGTQAWKYVSHVQPGGIVPSTLPVSRTWVQPIDVLHDGESLMLSSGNPKQPIRATNHSNQAPSYSKKKGLGKCHAKKGFLARAVNKKSGVIEIRATDKLIHQIERMIYGTKTPNPVQVEEAKLILREHEREILQALNKLTDVSDGDESPREMQHYYPWKEYPVNVPGTWLHSMTSVDG